MDRERGKLYQDRLYGTKVLGPLAVAIIDTPEFQRLAGLRQLGFAYQSYRGAQHTRFEHSIGTYFLSRTILRRIVQNHDRLMLDHPGGEELISDRFATYPPKWIRQGAEPKKPSFQAKWRGLVEVVSTAALLHDIGHVPFGHTLEDEFTGIFDRHDHLASPRLYKLLFDEASDLARVFSDELVSPWIAAPSKNAGIKNSELAQLIYVLLNWKESIDPAHGFLPIIDKELGSTKSVEKKERLQNLRNWYETFRQAKLFHPFMCDAIGNTICADLLDYLPRDRRNLGMEVRLHGRLQRYFTISEGTLYKDEGRRLSIMVTRKARGGQRRDVTTAVLDIMRERYEMAERVYYHHKKAAASTMLAKLAQLARDAGAKPRDDERVYPAPWQGGAQTPDVPHMLHLSDSELIDYLGRQVTVPKVLKALQERLYMGLKYRRKGIYATLMVIDTNLAHISSRSIEYMSEVFRGPVDSPSDRERLRLERNLARDVGAEDGDILIYCPGRAMQSKEVDVRLEITPDRILPLSVQRESFAFQDDLKVLEQYYSELWRSYVFVAPEIFKEPQKCRQIVSVLCGKLGIPLTPAFAKVRGYDFDIKPGIAVSSALQAVHDFVQAADLKDVPQNVLLGLLMETGDDQQCLDALISGADFSDRLTVLFEISTLKAEASWKRAGLKKQEKQEIAAHCKQLATGQAEPYREVASAPRSQKATSTSFTEYARNVVAHALGRTDDAQE